MSHKKINVLDFLKQHNINPKQLPSDMPEALQETVNDFLSMQYDWDPEPEDDEETTELKLELMQRNDEIIELLTQWLAANEITVPLTRDQRMQQALRQVYESGKKQENASVLVAPKFLVELGLAKKESQTGTINFGPFTAKRAFDELKWSLFFDASQVEE